jgi:cytochrome c biogenesis factor
MRVGDHAELAGWRFTLRRGIAEVQGPNYAALRARFSVQRDGGAPFVLEPEKRLYKVQQMPMTEAAIDSGLTRDLYVALGEALDEKTWTVRLLRQALRRLDLGRRGADGAGRPAGAGRPPLPAARRDGRVGRAGPSGAGAAA